MGFRRGPRRAQPAGTDLNQVRVTLFTELCGWGLHQVVRGDTLARIVRDHGQDTRVGDVLEANRDTVTDPDRIFPGQVLPVPHFDPHRYPHPTDAVGRPG